MDFVITHKRLFIPLIFLYIIHMEEVLTIIGLALLYAFCVTALSFVLTLVSK